MEKKTAGQALNDVRVEANVTYQKLADKIGAKSAQAIQNLLNPKRNITTDNFIKLAEALGYDVIIRNRVNDKEVIIVSNEGDSE